MLNRSDLHEYQRRGISFILNKRRCGLFLDMGLGKTTTTLTAISDVLDGFGAKKVLVVAPLRVANTVWAQEAKRWSHLKHLHVSVCTGSEKQRIKALSIAADIYVINRENVTWLVDLYRDRWPFDFVVIDESSSFKDSGSKRFKSLRKILPQTEHFVILTGTPSPNGLLDVWSQIYLLDFGMTLGRTMTAYKQRFFQSDYMGYKWFPKDGAADKIHNLLGNQVISMSAADYLELPDRIDLTVDLDLPAKVMDEYLEFERTLLAQLPEGDQVEAINAAVLANKLLQFCNGTLYTDDLGNWSELHTAKLDALGDLIEENQGENILVAYNFKADLARLLKRFPQARVLDKDPQTVEDWNAGSIPLLLAHPASAGHGLNLQSGGSMIIWFGLNWSLELDQQFNARLHRQGQDKPVRIIRLAVNGGIDQRVLSVLADKNAGQAALLSALKPKG